MTEQEAMEYISDVKNDELIDEFFYADDIRESFDMAIKALGKQIPKQFVWKKDIHGVGRMSCPNCKEHYIRNPYKNGRHKHSEVIFPYCPWCGQKLDWEEEKPKAEPEWKSQVMNHFIKGE